LSLSLAQVREKLRQQGLSVSPEKLREVLRFVDWAALQPSLNGRYQRRAAQEVQIERRGDQYCLSLGDLHWQVPVDGLALTQKILDLWLNDITLSALKIAAKLLEEGRVEKIGAATVRDLVRQVDGRIQ
jgi:hypothetical protein